MLIKVSDKAFKAYGVIQDFTHSRFFVLCTNPTAMKPNEVNHMRLVVFAEKAGLSVAELQLAINELAKHRLVTKFYCFEEQRLLINPEFSGFDYKDGGVASSIFKMGYHEQSNKHSVRRQARRDALINDFSTDQEKATLSYFNGRCALTGKDVPLHVDHVLPLAVGHGGTTLSNMLPIGQRLNSSKGAKNIFEWYEENGDRFDVVPELFAKAIEYLAELNEMTTQDYRDYVYECHANPNDILTEAI